MSLEEMYRKYKAYRAQRTALNEKISRLKDAYDAVDCVKRAWKQLRKNIDNELDDTSSDWRGETRKGFVKGDGELDNMSDGIYRNYDAVQDSINMKINELKSQRSFIENKLSWVDKLIREAQNALN